MKQIFTSLFLIFFVVAVSVAQDKEKDSPPLDAIRTPNAPAFTVLGVQPTSIEKPSTPADITLALDNATEGFTRFPQNFALELSPYWLGKSARSLTWEEDQKRSIEATIVRSLSFSFATTNKKVNDADIRGLSYGVRTFLLSGRMSDKSVEAIKALDAEMSDYSRALQASNAETRRKLEDEFQRNMIDATGDNAKQQALIAEYTRKKKELNDIETARLNEIEEREDTKALQKFAPEREGLMLEVAFAGAYKSSETDEELKKGGYAFWITPSYTMENLTLLGVYRRQKDSLDLKSDEYGLRLLYRQNRFAISVEFLRGKYDDKDAAADKQLNNRERMSVFFEYAVDNNISVYLSFGQDNKNVRAEGVIFNNLGLRYNLFKKEGRFKMK